MSREDAALWERLSRFWADVARQDAAALREWFAPEAEVYWHCTDERFTAEEYIRANCEYPGDWEGAVERAEWTEDGCVSVTAVWPKDRSARFHAVSFFRFAEDRITRLDEYWADDGPRPSGGRKSTSAVPSGEAEPSGKVSTLHTQRLQPRDTAEAAEILRRGGLLGIPTETVYGLGPMA